jgi:hypothetical protein
MWRRIGAGGWSVALPTRDMPLSSHLSEQLLDVYVRKVRDSVPNPRLKWGGHLAVSGVRQPA